ncbi:MAG: maleylacetoacetate isomerase [Sphingomonadaceae bacterium]
MQIYGYFRSSAAFRVRIALALKGLDAETIPVHLRKGEQRDADYHAVNPHGLVPALIDDGATLTQSLAIVEYLDEVHPEPPLLPADPVDRAWVRALAQAVACDIHPIQNLRVLNYLRANFAADDGIVRGWCQHWIATGFDGLETMLTSDARTGAFCYGNTPGLADIVLVPQIANAINFKLDLAPYPTLTRIFDMCMALPAFADAHPNRQPDAE